MTAGSHIQPGIIPFYPSLIFFMAALWLFVNIRFENRERKWFKFIFRGAEWTPLMKAMQILEKWKQGGDLKKNLAGRAAFFPRVPYRGISNCKTFSPCRIYSVWSLWPLLWPLPLALVHVKRNSN